MEVTPLFTIIMDTEFMLLFMSRIMILKLSYSPFI